MPLNDEQYQQIIARTVNPLALENAQLRVNNAQLSVLLDAAQEEIKALKGETPGADQDTKTEE